MKPLRLVVSAPLFLCLLFAGCAPRAAAGDAEEAKGHLVIIGGGDRPQEVMKRFVELAGGPGKARVVVIPLASGEAEEAGERMVAEFRSLGVGTARWILFSRDEALKGTPVAALTDATGIYFTGGDQVRITRVIVGTPVHQVLLRRYRDGAAIGGTSAGAAIMSKVMITGDELINKDSTAAFGTIQKGNVQTVEGLGFLENVIVDQHFVRRKRLNRLISVVLEHPELPGVGIDESTALIVKPGGGFEVMGEGTVVVVDGRDATDIRTDARGNLAARNIRMQIVRSGETFELTAPGRRPGPADR